MSILSDILHQKSGTKISILAVANVDPTVQSRKRILELIELEDEQFIKKIEGKTGFSFTFGDKYFFPIDEETMLAVPFITENFQDWIIKYVEGFEWRGILYNDFLKHKNKFAKEAVFFNLSP